MCVSVMSKIEHLNKKPASFIAPKKRSGGKKGALALSSHGDFIMQIQGQNRSPAVSPSEDQPLSVSTPTSNGPVDDTSTPRCSQELLGSQKLGSQALSSSQGLSSTDELSRSPSLDLVHDTRRKKKVNICTESSNDPLVAKTGTSSSASLDDVLSESEPTSCKSPASVDHQEPCLTLTGTIKRGRKAGQNVDVKLNMSREELEIIEAAISDKNFKNPASVISMILFSTLCIPLVFIVATIYNFYMATLTWYNIFNYFSNHKKVCAKICVSPFLILLYPFLIVPLSLVLGINAALMQISVDWIRWKQEVLDLEKGFFGYICSIFKLEDCSPYDVVVIMDIKDTNLDQNVVETEQP